jgi:hypothetical protein
MNNRSAPNVVFLVNGGEGCASAERARRFAAATPFLTNILYRSGSRRSSVRSMRQQLCTLGPDLIYCLDLAFVPLLAKITARSSALLVVDTGDYPSAFLKYVEAGPGKVLAAKVMEEWVYRNADVMVVRGFHHAAVLRGNNVPHVEVIPDGVDFHLSSLDADRLLRRRLGLDNVLTVGIAGYFTWYKKFGAGLGAPRHLVLAA